MYNLKLNINTILHTKDGSVVGNGIVVDKSGEIFTVKTDYGNVFKASEKEVLEVFNIAPMNVQDLYIGTHKHSVNEDVMECRDYELFRKRRKSLGLTQLELSKRLGLKTNLNVSRFENGYITSIGKFTYKKAIKIFDSLEHDAVLD